jgi:hypothetical protein
MKSWCRVRARGNLRPVLVLNKQIKMHCQNNIRLVVALIVSLVGAPLMSVSAASLSPSGTMSMHAPHHKKDVSRDYRNCSDPGCLSNKACATHCNFACSAIVGIVENTPPSSTHTSTQISTRPIGDYAPVVPSLAERPPIDFS